MYILMQLQILKNICHPCILYEKRSWLNAASVSVDPPSRVRRREEWERDWWSNMFSIQLRCHTWATRNKQSCLCDRERRREGNAEREGESERMGFLCQSRPWISLVSPDLIYVNSTCRLWDKAFNTSDRNFMAYLLWKYFDGKSHSVSFLSNNIPAPHRWGFCKADLQIVKFFHQAHL